MIVWIRTSSYFVTMMDGMKEEITELLPGSEMFCIINAQRLSGFGPSAIVQLEKIDASLADAHMNMSPMVSLGLVSPKAVTHGIIHMDLFIYFLQPETLPEPQLYSLGRCGCIEVKQTGWTGLPGSTLEVQNWPGIWWLFQHKPDLYGFGSKRAP